MKVKLGPSSNNGAASVALRPITPAPGVVGEHPAVWTFLTNHSHVLICLVRNPELRLRDVAELVGITERAVQRIVADLEEARILTRIRDGRRNRYEIHTHLPLRHPLEAHCTIHDLIGLVLCTEPPPE